MFVASSHNTMHGFRQRQALKLVDNNVEHPPQIQEFPTLAEFQALLKRVAALEAASNTPLILAPITPKPQAPYRANYHTIARRICRVVGVTREHLLSDRRDRRVIFARQAVMYWACRLLPHSSLPAIGRMMHRDHTTVLHGRRAYVEKRARMGRTLGAAE